MLSCEGRLRLDVKQRHKHVENGSDGIFVLRMSKCTSPGRGDPRIL